MSKHPKHSSLLVYQSQKELASISCKKTECLRRPLNNQQTQLTLSFQQYEKKTQKRKPKSRGAFIEKQNILPQFENFLLYFDNKNWLALKLKKKVLKDETN